LIALKYIKNAEVIKKIYYSTFAELLYLTQDGKAKIINISDLFEPNEEYVVTTDFSQPSGYDKVIADSTEYITTAHWTEKNSKIEVYRKNFNCVEKFILEIPSLQDRYDYVGKHGQYTSGTGYILHVAIRGKLVLVLTTDGNIRLWSLPEEHYICKQSEKEELLKIVEEFKPIEKIKDTIERKDDSHSPERNYKISDFHQSTIDSDDKKKKGFSRIKVFSHVTSKENNSGKKSRESSPTGKRSRETSPSPRINSSKLGNFVDFKETYGEEI